SPRDVDIDSPASRARAQGVDGVLDQVDQYLTDLLWIGARGEPACALERHVDPSVVEPRPEVGDGTRDQLPEVDPAEAELLAARKAQQRCDLTLDPLELDQDQAMLDGERRSRFLRELLREAPRRGHRVADLVRDARRKLTDRRELLGVGERTLD